MIELITQIVTLAVQIIILVKVMGITKNVQDVHLEINSRLTELLALTERSSHAAGMLRQKENEEAVREGQRTKCMSNEL